ncbi:MAG: right-handed parallel beta-helix repeat-containing protein, partial [Opitutales bacterium]|nr:right-handed parallel beta-helix repeat-containing protein [Opitutales bacterium]
MKKGILTVLFGILSAACALAGERFYVATSGSDTNDGKSWAAAFADVQTAIDAAAAAATRASPSEVWIAKGTYKHGSPLVMKNNVAIYGGFAGSETSLDARSGGNKTIFAGEISYSVIKNDYSQSNPLTRSAKLNSVTITSGETGIYNNYSSPEITECTVSGNAHDGIYNGYSTPAIVSCAIIGNGRCGIPNLSSSPDIINCTISGNNYGGVINEPYSSPRITNCTINGNDSFGIGSNMSSSPRITNCIIWNNTKYSIYNLDAESRPIVNSCIVYGGYNDGVNIIASDPLLGKLGDYGGKVQTIPVLAKSPAIGAGIATSSTPATDARGIVRAAAPTI